MTVMPLFVRQLAIVLLCARDYPAVGQTGSESDPTEHCDKRPQEEEITSILQTRSREASAAVGIASAPDGSSQEEQDTCVPPAPGPDPSRQASPAYMVLVGSGGCDGTDKACETKEKEERKVVPLGVDADGSLLSQDKCWNTNGKPVWFASSVGCVFVSMPDTSSIGVYTSCAGDATCDNLGRFVSEVSVQGVNPVWIDVTSDGKYVVVADYKGPDDTTDNDGAGVELYSISSDCDLTFADMNNHTGGSESIIDRQSAAHPHSAVAGPNNLVFVADLGMDKVVTYRVIEGKLVNLTAQDTQPGFGPRVSLLHPTRDQLFVLGEMGNAVNTYNLDAVSGDLTFVSTTVTTPDTNPGSNGTKAAMIAISPDGRYLYASNRAFAPGYRNTIAVFGIGDSGSLALKQHVDTVSFPRGMVMMPDGKVMLVASQTTGEVVSFNVDSESGLLTSSNSSQYGPAGAASFLVLPPRAPEDPIWPIGSRKSRRD